MVASEVEVPSIKALLGSAIPADTRAPGWPRRHTATAWLSTSAKLLLRLRNRAHDFAAF